MVRRVIRKVGWRSEEDYKLREYVKTHGARHWATAATYLGTGRNANSCRLRWFNHLSPHVRLGKFTRQEILTILNLHQQFGNRWARIAKELPGRTDNQIKNFWNTRVKKEAKKINCDIKSEEFLRIMTARLTEEGDDEEEEEVHIIINSNYNSAAAADEELIDDEFWSNYLANLDDSDLLP